MIFDFLWYPSEVELIERKKLFSNYSSGGLCMVDITSRYKAALIYKLKEIAQANNKSEFWIKVAFYNIGVTLRKVNRSLYSNLEPHKVSGNSYWNKIKVIFEEIVEDFDWTTVKFKDLYISFKQKSELPDKLKPWSDIQYFNNKRFFTNHERQISFLVAHDALQLGQFKRRTSVFVDVESWFSYNCKFCNGYEDNLDHLLAPDCIVMKQVFLLTKHLFRFVLKKDITFDRQLILCNEINGFMKMKIYSEDYMIALAKMKLAAILKRVILDEKRQCDIYGTFIGCDDRLNFVNKLVSKIRISFLFFINNTWRQA